MTKQRLISVCLVLAMIISTLVFPAYAENEYDSSVSAESETEISQPIDDTDEIGITEAESLISETEVGDESAELSDDSTVDAAASTYYDDYGVYFDKSTGTITDADETFTSFNLPKSIDGVEITAIGSSAFQNCTRVTHITPPENLKTIGDGAFEGCVNLQNVDFTLNRLESIGSYAFQNCTGLLSVKISGNILTTISRNAFEGCSKLAGVDLSNNISLTTIGRYAFSGCENLTAVKLPQALTQLGYRAFSGCVSLPSIEIPANTKAGYDGGYGEWIYGCTALKKVKIAEGATFIADYAFRNCTSFTEIEIPDTVKTIGSETFANCTQLREIPTMNGVTTISNSAFSGCTGLTDVNTLSNCSNLTTIGNGAFSGCTGLRSIDALPGNVASIGESAFSNCSSLASVDLSLNRLESIGGSVFQNCINLKSVKFACNLLKSIDSYAFSGCINLTSIDLSANPMLSTIGRYAFTDCKLLNSVKLPQALTQLGYRAFSGCVSLPSIEIPANTKAGYDGGYGEWIYGCTALKKVKIAEGATFIADYAFRNCTSFTEIEIPDTVKTIGSETFANCTQLREIPTMNGVTTISDSAFSGCTGLASINNLAKARDLTTIGNSAFYNCSALMSIDTLPSRITSIGQNAFYGCSSLTDISSLPSRLETIGSSAFSNCKSLNNISFACSRLTTIGSNAFEGCVNLKTADLSGNSRLSTIGRYAFTDCKLLNSVKLPQTLTQLGYRAFSGCVSLPSIEIPANTKAGYDGGYGEWIYGCTALKKVKIAEGATFIADYAFRNCTSFTEIEIPDTVKTIGSETFANCTQLREIPTMNGVTTIGYSAFSGCTSLESLDNLPDSLEEIGSSAFQNCTYLEQINVLPSNLTKIGQNAFYGCKYLERVLLPIGLTTIGNGAFADNSYLEYIFIPETVTSIGNNAFSNDSDLTIYGMTRTTAETYANSNNIPFVALTEPPVAVIPVSDVKISKTEMTLGIGGTERLTATVLPASASNKNIMWKTNNAAVATVNDGLVSGISEGTAIITVTTEDKGFAASCIVTVSKDGPKPTINPTDTPMPTATLEPTDVPTTPEPVATPTLIPTDVPTTPEPVATPTLIPTDVPTTPAPAETSTPIPTDVPVTPAPAETSTPIPTYVPVTPAPMYTPNPAVTSTPEPVISTEVPPSYITGIRIKAQPDKTTVVEGTALDTSGLRVEAVYSDGKAEEISDYTLSGYDMNLIGVQTITVEYMGYTASFNITVEQKSMIGLVISQKPNKRAYTQGEQLDTTGMIVTAMYNNGTSEETLTYIYSGYDPNYVGSQTISVSYNGFSAAFTVTVSPKEQSAGMAETPKISISSFIGGKTVTLTTATEGARIYYTLDGTAPTTSSNLYDEPIVLTETASVKAIAVKEGMNPSKTAGGKITVGNTETPTSSHKAGQLEVGTVITLRSETSGSMIYYTTDGSEPTTESKRYSGGIAITDDVTIKAIAVKDGCKNSGIFEAAYTVPKIEPGSAAISVGSVSGAAGDTLSIPVYLFTDGDSGITEYRLTINYDASKFDYESVTPAEGASDSDLFTSVSKGAVTVLYSGAAIESGEVCDINLKALESDEDGEYPITIAKDSVKLTAAEQKEFNIDVTDGAITLIGSINSNLELKSDVMLTDSSGNDITDKSGIKGDVTANVTLENISGDAAIEPMTVNIIMAVYDRNECLVSMSVMDADLSDLNYVFTNTVDIPENVEVGSIKLMVWNGLSDMTPMSAASEIL